MPIAVTNTSTYIQGGIEAYVVSRHPTTDQVTIRLDLYYRRTNSYSGSTGPTSLSTDFIVTSHSLSGYNGSFTLAGGQQDVWQYAGITVDQTIGAGANGRTINVGWNTHTASQSGYWTGSGSGEITFTNAPTGISCSDIVPGIDSVTANVFITGWGGEGNSSTRYRELQLWTYSSGLTEPRRYQPAYGDSLSGNITVSNSSSGSLNIVGNTHYVLGMYASNGVYNTESRRIGSVTTLAPKDTLTVSDSDSSSITVDYSVPADGGYYAKTLSYSIDNGATWVDFVTLDSGSASTGTFTIPNLEPNTEYTIQSRVVTTSGTTTNDAITGRTIGPAKPSLTSTNATSTSTTWQYKTTTYGGGANGITRLYIGTNSTPTTQRDTTTDENVAKEYTYSGLQPNQIYYARARAESTFDGELVYSDYTDVVSRVTPCDAPTLNSLGVMEYETITTVTVRGNITIPADSNYYQKTLQYRYKVGNASYTTWATATTFDVGTQQTYNLNITNLPVDTIITVDVRTSTTAGQTAVSTKQITTSGAHQGPTNFDYSIVDQNTALQTWLSTFGGYVNPIYVQGQSQVALTILNTTKGTCSDGTTISKYVSTLVIDNNQQETTTFTYPLTIPFGTPTPINRATDSPSNEIKIRSRVYDTLDAYTEVEKTALALSWQAPTIAISGERLTRMGAARIDYSGIYARLQDNSLNSGNDINTLTIEYRVLDMDGNVLTDWTSNTNYNTTIDSVRPFLRNYTGRIALDNIPIQTPCVVEVRTSDHFASTTESLVLDIWEIGQVNDPVVYDIELWDWKTNTYVADLSYLVVGDLNIEWVLDDVEQVSFDMDLLEFEKKCTEMGVDPEELLKPYTHDIRIRRNGEYILGCQLVEANISIANNPPSKISVKGTGFLNLFKDQYIMDESWSKYTYAQIAQKLVKTAQKPDCLIKNPTGDIDTSYWLAADGTVSWGDNSDGSSGISGGGYIIGNRSGTGWIVIGSQMSCGAGTNISIDLWVKARSGDYVAILERKFITSSTEQRIFTTLTAQGGWQHIIVNGLTSFDQGYLIIGTERQDSSTQFCIDDVYVYAVDDDATLCDMKVKIGVDTASVNQSNEREVAYSLQNVKDALMELASFEEDKFDFEFLPDRTFNVYSRKGSDKLDLNIIYPGNVDSTTIQRSASNVANKIINIGSGIGDERLQFTTSNFNSRDQLGTHESVVTNSNVSLQQTLMSQAIKELNDRKNPTDLPSITIKDGSINPSNVETGDIIFFQIQDDTYLGASSGEYRIMKMSVSVSEDSVESVKLTVENVKAETEPQMVRYIRSRLAGSDLDGGSQWVQIQALMLVGDRYINVAQGKPVYASMPGDPATPAHIDPNVITNGNIDSNNFFQIATNYNSASVTIDLGDEYPLDYVKAWQYYLPLGGARTYYQNTLSVGTTLPDRIDGDEPLELVLWQDPRYPSLSEGQKSSWIQEQNTGELSKPRKVRYIKEYIKGNSVDIANHWVEITALEKIDNSGQFINRASGATVSGYPNISNGNYAVNGDWTNTNQYAEWENSDGSSIIIDLGAEYPIDYIKIWHYYGDNRTYYHSILSVGTELTPENEPLETIVWENGDNEGWVETSAGRVSPWIQGL